MMLILQRYLLRDLLRVFLLALVGVSAVMVVLLLGQLVSRGTVSGEHALKAVPLFLPLVLAYTMPATLLFAVTLVYGRFARDNEFDAVRMSGVHPVVILLPAVTLSVAVSCVVLYFAADLIPQSYYRVRNLSKNIEVAKDAFFRALEQSGTWGDGVFTIWTGKVEGDTAYGVHIEKRSRKTRRPELVVEAKSATFHFDAEEKVVEVRARQARVETFGPAGAVTARLSDTHVQRLPLLPPPAPRARDLPLGALLRRIREEANSALEVEDAPESGDRYLAPDTAGGAGGETAPDTAPARREQRLREIRRMRTEVHLRLNLAMSGVSFALVAAPLAIWFRKGHILAAFLVALGPMLLFHLITFTAKNLCHSGAWPAATPWAANGLLWLMAAVLLWRLFRR